MMKSKDRGSICVHCTRCCGEVIATVTHADALRLVQATGLPAQELVKLYTRAEIESDPSDRSWIEFTSGRRMLGLKRNREQCILLAPAGLCAVYAVRPLLCRTFPFEFRFSPDGRPTGIQFRGSAADGSLPCPAYPETIRMDADLRSLAEQERFEREEYYRIVERWNAQKRHGGTERFYEFIGLQ
jgi:Fe-S-cluster containining protein